MGSAEGNPAGELPREHLWPTLAWNRVNLSHGQIAILSFQAIFLIFLYYFLSAPGPSWEISVGGGVSHSPISPLRRGSSGGVQSSWDPTAAAEANTSLSWPISLYPSFSFRPERRFLGEAFPDWPSEISPWWNHILGNSFCGWKCGCPSLILRGRAGAAPAGPGVGQAREGSV